MIAGSGGAGAMLLLLFLAVTSATSAELIAVSNLLAYDWYLPCARSLRAPGLTEADVNPQATEARILTVQHISVCVWGLCMAVLGVIFFCASIRHLAAPTLQTPASAWAGSTSSWATWCVNPDAASSSMPCQNPTHRES